MSREQLEGLIYCNNCTQTCTRHIELISKSPRLKDLGPPQDLDPQPC